MWLIIIFYKKGGGGGGGVSLQIEVDIHGPPDLVG